MVEQQKVTDEAGEESEEGGRQRSKIAFPYADLSSAMELVDTIHSKVGNGQCSFGQLAAWADASAKSSGFRIQVAAARLFGLIESEDAESYRLAPIGRRVVDPNAARKARADAFLSVPLFAKLYEAHKDTVLPPAAAIEREIVALGVAEKQKERARQIFERSAEQAGFSEHGKNRLVMPAVKESAPPVTGGADGHGKGTGTGNGGGSGGGEDLGLDPLIMALLRKIPKTAQGWPADKRLRWFKTFAMNVSEVYDNEGPVELSITITSGHDLV